MGKGEGIGTGAKARRERAGGPTALSRRDLLLAAGALLVPSAARAAAAQRVAVIDWALLETVLALGVTPVAATELIQYRKLVVEPAVPAATADIGLRGTPNYEMLRITAPDLILISNFYERQRPQLERIAPVLSADVFVPGAPTLDLAAMAARAVGAARDLEARAERLAAEVEAELDRAAAAVRGRAHRPVFVISLGDARHFRAFGPDSLLGGVLARIGLRNAWAEDTRYSATAPIGFEALALVPEAMVVVVGPVPPEARSLTAESRLWQALPMVAADRVRVIAPVNHFGGLPSARRFAGLLAEAVLDMPDA